MLVRSLRDGLSIFGSSAQNAMKMHWGVVRPVCLIPVVRSIPCEDPKLEAADDHSLLVNAVG